MIDIDKYEEAIIFKQELECGGVIAVGRDDLLNIIDMLRQSGKDAARYRWLRDDAVEHDLCISVSLESSEWNAFIDEAMKCSGDDK